MPVNRRPRRPPANATLDEIVNWAQGNSNNSNDNNGKGKSHMNKFGTFLIILLIALVLGGIMLGGCVKRVDAGYEGVKFNRLGGAKGLTETPLQPGIYFVSINEDVYEYPVHMEQYMFTQDIRPESPRNEEISFQTKEGLAVSCDISIMGQTTPGMSPKVFSKFRKPFGDILKTFFYQEVKDAFNRYSSPMPVETVYGEGKITLLKQVTDDVTKKGKDWGIDINQISYLSNIRVPKQVEDSINLKVVATQQAQQRENEIATAKAEASKKVETAKGEANKRIEEAKGEAQALNTQGEALRQNPQVLELRRLQIIGEAIAKWDGHTPNTLFMGGMGGSGDTKGKSDMPAFNLNLPLEKPDTSTPAKK